MEPLGHELTKLYYYFDSAHGDFILKSNNNLGIQYTFAC